MCHKVLMVVPTCNRPGMVKEVLTYEGDYYKRYPMDLCYCDSSADDRTKKVIEEYRDRSSLNLYYKRMSEELCLDYKLVEILKEVETTSYEYLWLVNDSVSIQKEALDIVFSFLEDGYDLIRLPLAGDGEQSDRICTSPNEWFCRCSQGMAHMASTVMCTSLLKKASHDWDYLSKRYIGGNELGDGHGYFFMVAFFLEQILKLDEFKGIFIGNRVKWRRDSPLKKDQVYWKDYVFPAWAKSYVDTILRLPAKYSRKKEVIRHSDNLSPGRFSASMLIRYRLDGLYSFREFLRYRRYFPLITNTSAPKCMAISCVPVFILKALYGKNHVEEGMWETRLRDILKKTGSKKLIIYGAGLYGERVAKKLRDSEEGDRVMAVAVTDRSNSVLRLEGIKVYEIQELSEYRERAAVIIAALPDAACSIRKVLKKHRFKYYYALLGY